MHSCASAPPPSAPLRSASSAPSAILDALKARPRGPRDREGRPRSEVRRHRAGPAWHRARRLGMDTMLASYLLDSTRTGHPLEATALEHLSYKALTEEDVCGRGAKAVNLAVIVPVERCLNYAGERADLALQLANRLSPMLTSDRLDALDKLYREIERPLIPVLARMEQAGVRLDGRGARGAVEPRRSRARHAQRADLRAGRRGLQHQLAAAALEDPVRQAAAPRAQAEREDEDGVDRRRGARGARPRARAAAADPGMARRCRS